MLKNGSVKIYGKHDKTGLYGLRYKRQVPASTRQRGQLSLTYFIRSLGNLPDP
jgi:hypothetical protein